MPNADVSLQVQHVRLHGLANGSTVELTDDPERVDEKALWGFLSTEAYWGEGA